MRIVIPMAGLGSRFVEAGYTDHKPLIKVNGKTLLEYTVSSLGIDGQYHLVVRDLGGHYLDSVRSVMDSLDVFYQIHVIDRVTTGAAETALKALEDDYDDELVVTNCDQYLDWKPNDFLEESRKYDVSVLTYDSDDPKNSFAEIVNDKVVNIVEKKAMSRHALVGVHYWKKAQDFVRTTGYLMKDRDVKRETYVSETINYLIREGKSVAAVPIEGRYWCTGTPEHLTLFKGYVMEYKVRKPNTYFFDLDGTVLMHAHRYSNLPNQDELCPGVREALDEIDSRGDKIILVSARKESAREITEKTLQSLAVPYDQLVLNVGQGKRVIVNDKMTEDSDSRCSAVDVITDEGWNTRDLD